MKQWFRVYLRHPFQADAAAEAAFAFSAAIRLRSASAASSARFCGSAICIEREIASHNRKLFTDAIPVPNQFECISNRMNNELLHYFTKLQFLRVSTWFPIP